MTFHGGADDRPAIIEQAANVDDPAIPTRRLDAGHDLRTIDLPA